MVQIRNQSPYAHTHAHTQECETFTPVARLTFGGRIHSAGRAGSVWRRKMRSTSDQNPAWEVLQRAAVALVRSARPRAENQRIESDFGVVPGWWGMTSPVYSALPQELLLEAEPRRPDKNTPRLVNNKENNRTRYYRSSDRPLTHFCNSRGWPRGSRWKESLPFYQPSGGETAQRWKMVDCERHQMRTWFSECEIIKQSSLRVVEFFEDTFHIHVVVQMPSGWWAISSCY